MIEIIQDNLLNSSEQYIAHQCNCISVKASGIALAIFTKFPYANVYETRRYDSRPGSIFICGNGEEDRYVINMMGQYNPGKPKDPRCMLDGSKAREIFFHNCLKKIAKIKDLQSIAFPYNIGCGMAGGDWNSYCSMLKSFEKYVNDKFATKVYLYKRLEDS